MRQSCRYFRFFSESCFEWFDVDVLDEWVPFVGSFFFASFSWDSDSDSSGQVSDALVPDELIEFGVDSDIFSFHHLGDDLSDFRYGSWCFLLELNSVSGFVNINSCINGAFWQTFSLFFLSHFTTRKFIIIKKYYLIFTQSIIIPKLSIYSTKWIDCI